ncbi:hypothetical protein INR49_014871 [Caranx melampygus]|nr:hypothetical protein INR49_014871 [Caranx melampygus]
MTTGEEGITPDLMVEFWSSSGAAVETAECVSQAFDPFQHAVQFMWLLFQKLDGFHLHPEYGPHSGLTGALVSFSPWELHEVERHEEAAMDVNHPYLSHPRGVIHSVCGARPTVRACGADGGTVKSPHAMFWTIKPRVGVRYGSAYNPSFPLARLWLFPPMSSSGLTSRLSRMALGQGEMERAGGLALDSRSLGMVELPGMEACRGPNGILEGDGGMEWGDGGGSAACIGCNKGSMSCRSVEKLPRSSTVSEMERVPKLIRKPMSLRGSQAKQIKRMFTLKSRPMAECLCRVFVVDLQAGVVCDVPVGRRGVRR